MDDILGEIGNFGTSPLSMMTRAMTIATTDLDPSADSRALKKKTATKKDTRLMMRKT